MVDPTANSQQAELIGAVDPFEQALRVFEVVEASDTTSGELPEERFRRVVRGDPGRAEDPGLAAPVDEVAEQLREDDVIVHVARAAERETSALAQIERRALREGARLFIHQAESRVVALHLLDEALAGGGVRGVRNFGRAGGEELLIAELHLLPGRVAEHAVEAALPLIEHLGELELPVERAHLVHHPRQLPLERVAHLLLAACAMVEQRRLRGWSRRFVPERPVEGGGPEVGGTLLVGQLRCELAVFLFLEQHVVRRILFKVCDSAGFVGLRSGRSCGLQTA